MSGNRLGSGCTVRIVVGGRPKLFCRHHSDGGDLNQDFARLRLGNRTYYWLQIPFVRKLHCFHLCHCFTPWFVSETGWAPITAAPAEANNRDLVNRVVTMSCILVDLF